MIFIRKLLINANLTNFDLCSFIGMTFSCFENKYRLRVDFTIKELESIKDFFVKKGVISDNFDIGDLLIVV